MTGKKEIVEAEQPLVEPPVEALEPQPKTYTQEEVDTLLTTEKDESLKMYQGLQRVLSRKDQELERLGKAPQSAPNRTLRAMLDEMAKGESYEDPARQARIEALRGELTHEEQLQGQEAYTNTIREKMNRQILDAGLDPDDEKFDGVHDAFSLASAFDGNFERAQKRLDRILGKAKPNTPEPKPKETETHEDYDARKEKEFMVKHGLLTPESSTPSGAGLSQMNPDQLAEKMKDPAWFAEHEAEIDELYKKGKFF